MKVAEGGVWRMFRASESWDGSGSGGVSGAPWPVLTLIVCGVQLLLLLLLPLPPPWSVETKPEHCLAGAPGSMWLTRESGSSLMSTGERSAGLQPRGIKGGWLTKWAEWASGAWCLPACPPANSLVLPAFPGLPLVLPSQVHGCG